MAAFPGAGKSDLLDFFQHLENRLGRTDEEALVVLAQTTAFQGVTTGAFTFSSHDSSPNSAKRCPNWTL